VVRRERKKKKGGALRWGAPLKAARGSGRLRRKRWAGMAAETTGEAMGMGKAAAVAVRRRSVWLGTSVWTMRLTGGPQAVLIFF
jgi:hypothetical protein